ncbi:hypothetical protein SteCoe_11739 [Stentor coeruleus]|uniref:Uncharacterized protein n=1 Tax=Stentor coeruleus TaxID=5963 RepID=A0A1R2CCE3_9CILI|nr:hypothetical protein SteCoe_11739 [Stentor coeruleus]
MKLTTPSRIRSKKEHFTPFSDSKSLYLKNKRVQSETPSLNKPITMGIQCDPETFYDTYGANNSPIIPDIKISSKTRKRSPLVQEYFRNTLRQPEAFKMRTITPDLNCENMMNVDITSKIQLNNTGDWNSIYIRKITNSHKTTEYNRPYCGYISKNVMRKPYKVVEFYPAIMVKINSKCNRNLPWTITSPAKTQLSITNLHRILRKNKAQSKINKINIRAILNTDMMSEIVYA